MNMQINSRILQIERSLAILSSRKEMIHGLDQDYHGYSHGVRNILLASKGKLSGICGPVAELLSVPKLYEIAIETALDGCNEYVIVETEQDAYSALEFLRQHQLGRATVLSLDKVVSQSHSERDGMILSRLDGYLGAAMDVVTFNDKYRELFSHILGHVVITSSLENTTWCSTVTNMGYLVVTLTGEYCKSGGIVAGGSKPPKHSGIKPISRKRVLKEIDEEMERITIELRSSR
ncbi:MAG: chromosome segregation protein [Paenibacillus sp.]|jgi:chromosome segregation protein|nr:chromosome segregation protein [Paenibacillus sp.]